MNDQLMIFIAGGRRVVSAEVLLKHIAVALRTVDLSAGHHRIEIYRDGSITINGQLAYTPPLPLNGAKSAADRSSHKWHNKRERVG